MTKLIDTKQAADILNVAYGTLVNSRNTGKLFGKESPSYEKINGKVVYKLDEITNFSDSPNGIATFKFNIVDRSENEPTLNKYHLLVIQKTRLRKGDISSQLYYGFVSFWDGTSWENIPPSTVDENGTGIESKVVKYGELTADFLMSGLDTLDYKQDLKTETSQPSTAKILFDAQLELQKKHDQVRFLMSICKDDEVMGKLKSNELEIFKNGIRTHILIWDGLCDELGIKPDKEEEPGSPIAKIKELVLMQKQSDEFEKSIIEAKDDPAKLNEIKHRYDVFSKLWEISLYSFFKVNGITDGIPK